MHVHNYLDLTQLNTVTHVLDLVILAARKFQLAPVIQLTQIAGTVDQLGIQLVQRVLDKSLTLRRP